ncbi:DUF4190 domain-containing protein [Nonomuraea sp. JJY05]|uniref:DUF4190 domain-containing protein n=1 Tax=Nonomuraea sp. JJY05 TaxID=3350255 RepID=UPI00373E248F
MRYHWTEYANPWIFARNAFRPDTADTEKPFQRLSDWRARIGTLFIIYLSIPTVDWQDILWSFTDKSSLAIFTGAVVALTAVLIVWLGSAHPVSPATGYYMRASLKRGAAALVSTLALAATVRTGVWAAIPFPFGWILGWWTVIFTFAMMWYSLRWVFGVSDVNNLLGPAVSAITAVFAFTVEAITDSSDLPHDIDVLINVSGLATVCLLALCEFLYEFSRREHTRAASDWHVAAELPRRSAYWNGLAVASLPVTVVACWPVGLALAVVALRQIRQTGERGAGLAWASMAFTAIFLLFMCGFLVWKSGSIF